MRYFLSELDRRLATQSYVHGYCASSLDEAVYRLVSRPDAAKYPHLSRWHAHLRCLLSGGARLPPASCTLQECGITTPSPPAAPAKAEEVGVHSLASPLGSPCKSCMLMGSLRLCSRLMFNSLEILFSRMTLTTSKFLICR